jgi:hypothetical protein
MAKKEKESYVAVDLILKFKEYQAYKQGNLREWRLLRSLYKGEFWQVFKKYLKEYTITPDWNYFEYVVQAFLNSVYSGAFIGTVTPRNVNDEQTVKTLNNFIAYHWNKWGMKNKFLHIGENGELYNLGAIRVDWDSKKSHIKLRSLSPQEVYLDPSTDNYKEGEAVFIERAVNINTLKKNPDFAEKVEEFIKTNKGNYVDKTIGNKITAMSELGVMDPVNQETTGTGASGGPRSSSNNKRVSLIECFIRNEEGNIDQVFILNEDTIIFEKLNLPLTNFPIVIYTPQRPDAGPYGNSKLNKILNTVISLNLLDSMEATQPYRLLNRVRFVNVDGRINMRSFADYGNTPGASFEVKGDPRTLVYYQDIPTIPDMSGLKNRLENSIFQVTGVDPQYKGRMTNSLQTTGATQAFQARVTMLTDNSRITMLEEFCEDITRLVLEYYFEYGGDQSYEVPQLSATGTNKVVDKASINFTKLREDKVEFDYLIAASTLLPMNQANLFESAKALYEMQGQYGFKKQVITEQDLVKWSDFPQKDLILQRLEKEEQSSTAENLVADLTNFASIFSRMLSQGLSEEEAAQQAISILIEEKNAMKQNPAIGQGFE